MVPGSKKINRKVAISAGSSAPLAMLATYGLAAAGVVVPVEIAIAGVSVLTSFFSLIVGWFTDDD